MSTKGTIFLSLNFTSNTMLFLKPVFLCVCVFFFKHMMDLPVEFPERQTIQALLQHCSQSNHAYAI